MMGKDKTPDEHAIERQQFGEVEWTVTPEEAANQKQGKLRKLLVKAWHRQK